MSGRKRKCRCESETSVVASQIPAAELITLESVIEAMDHTICAWRTINDCRVCAQPLKRSSFVQTYTNFAAKLVVLFEVLLQTHLSQPDQVEFPSSSPNKIKCSNTLMFLGDFKIDEHQSYQLALQIIHDDLIRLISLLEELQELSMIEDQFAATDGGGETNMPRLLVLLGRVASETK